MCRRVCGCYSVSVYSLLMLLAAFVTVQPYRNKRSAPVVLKRLSSHIVSLSFVACLNSPFKAV